MKVQSRSRVSVALALALLAPVSAMTLSGVATATDGIFVDPLATQIVFENTSPAEVVLGALATRSTGADFTSITGSGPYTVTGPGGYTFETDANYAVNQGGVAGANMRESSVRAANSMTYTKPAASNADCTDSAGVLVSGCVFLKSVGSVQGPNTTSYGSIFGPEVWTEMFTVTEALEVAFRYRVVGTGDDYEMYAFLVDVGTDDYADGTHTLIAHVRGKNQPWKFLTGTIPAAGKYRFRFVNGTYDRSGGFAVGSNTYLDPSFWVGRRNSISMDSITDKVRGSDDETFPISAKAISAGPVFFSVDPAHSARCAVGSASRNNDGSYGANVTVKASGTNGNCTIFAQSANFGAFVPAPQIFRTFNVCATAPTHGGGQGLSGQAVQGQRLEVTDGTINSCGDNYVRTYQWQVCNELPCTLDSHFSDYGSPQSLRGIGPDKDQKGVLSLNTSALEGKRLRAKITVTSPAGSFTVATAATEPVVGVKFEAPKSPSTSTGSGPASEPKPFVLPSGDTPQIPPGKVVVYEGGAPVVVTSEPVTVGGVQSIKVGGTTAGGGKFEMTIGGDCPTCAVTQSNTGDNVLGMEQAAAVRVGGYGFGPGSQVNVFVSSTTRLIGFFKADGDGAFLGSVKVPTDLPGGNHTVQVSGFTADNVIRSVSVGITVAKATPKACTVVKRKGKKPVVTCPKVTKKVVKKK